MAARNATKPAKPTTAAPVETKPEIQQEGASPPPATATTGTPPETLTAPELPAPASLPNANAPVSAAATPETPETPETPAGPTEVLVMDGGDLRARFALLLEADPSLAQVIEVAAELAGEVLTERLRQIAEEGHSIERDDAYTDYQLPRAAVCYAIRGAGLAPHKAALYWPWNPADFKPTGTDRDLIKAAALILAELQRRQRSRAQA